MADQSLVRSSANDFIFIQALSSCCNSSWSAPKPVGPCTLETAAVEGWKKKALRVVTEIDCSISSFKRFFLNVKNQKLFDTQLTSIELLFDGPDSRTMHSKYKASGLASARDFVTNNFYGPMMFPHINQMLSAINAQTTEDEDARSFFYVSSDAKTIPPVSGYVRGVVHVSGYFALPLPDKTDKIKLIYVACVDPMGNVPAFAYEGTYPDIAKMVGKIAELATMYHNMDNPMSVGETIGDNRPPSTRASGVGERPAEFEKSPSPLKASTSFVGGRGAADEPTPAATSQSQTRHKDPEEAKSGTVTPPSRHSSNPPSVENFVNNTSLAAPAKKAQAVKHYHQRTPSCSESSSDDESSTVLKPAATSEEPAQPTVAKSEEPQPAAAPTEPEPAAPTAAVAAVEEEASFVPPPPVSAYNAKQRPMMDMLLRLNRRNDWVNSKTLENCLMETCGTDAEKSYRISTEMNCSLETFAAFLADSDQVKKFDPMVDGFEVMSEADEIATLYTWYKPFSRLVTARDFCFNITKVSLTAEQAEKEGFRANTEVFLQAATHTDAKPAQKGYVRGKIFIFGYVATAAPGATRIRVENVMRVDAGGKIPKWVVDSAQADNCKKLATIRKLCEEWEKKMTKLVLERSNSRSQIRTPPTSVTPKTAPIPAATAAPPPPVVEPVEDASPIPPAGQVAEPSSPGIDAAEVQSVGSSSSPTGAATDLSASGLSIDLEETVNDIDAKLDDVRNFYKEEEQAVVRKLTDMHTGRGWGEINFTNGCRIESMKVVGDNGENLTGLRFSLDVKCTLDAFRRTVTRTDLVRKYDTHLDRYELLESPEYGTVAYTTYKNSKVLNGRDLCTLTCHRMLSEEDGAEAGLYTGSIRSAAFVSSSVNSQDMPDQNGLTRAFVQGQGYIAIATPPDAVRVRVFHIACVDPKRSKYVDDAVAEGTRRFQKLKELAEGGAATSAAVPAAEPATASPNTSPSKRVQAVEEEPMPEIDTAPLFNRMFRMHSGGSWSAPKQVGSCLVDTTPVDFASVKASRFRTEFLCSLSTLQEFLASQEEFRKYEKNLETMRFLEGPPNASITYTSYKSGSRLLSNRDFCTVTAQKMLSDEEASELGLYTKGIKSAVFAQNAINWREVGEQKGYVRGTVHTYGFLAIATPPEAKRVRVFHYSCIDPEGKIPTKFMDAAVSETAKKVLTMASICKKMQEDRDAAMATMVEEEVAEVPAVAPAAPAEPAAEQPVETPAAPVAEEPAQTTDAAAVNEPAAVEEEKPAQITEEAPAPAAAVPEPEATEPEAPQKQEEPAPAPAAAAAAPATTEEPETPNQAIGALSDSKRTKFARMLALFKRRDWKMGNVVEGCLMEECDADFSPHKVLRLSTEFNCSLETLSAFLEDTSEFKNYDPTMDKLELVAKEEDSVTVYTNYKQQSRFISPRDFCIATSRAFLSAANAVKETGLTDTQGVFIQSTTSVGGKPEMKGYVRGTIHVFGYVAVAGSDSSKIKVYNIACVDPGGKIPKWAIDAAKAENCKKLALIRKCCEKYSTKK